MLLHKFNFLSLHHMASLWFEQTLSFTR